MKKEDFIQNKKKENIQFGFTKSRSAAIKVIGVGGGGSNALSHMFEQGITGVDFIACNTDSQALKNNPVPVKIQLGVSTTEGLGAGADPDVGEKAALESLEEIKSVLDSNTKMTFITAGMGGGTGTGAAPIIAGISKEKGILTVGIVTIPFHFEGKMRLQQAQKGIESLRKNVDSLIVINNDKLRELYGNLGFKAGFAKADEVLTTAAKGIAEVITHHYKQNIDLRDTRTVLKESGTAVMGSAISVGENRAKEAVIQALDSPLLNDNKITGAKNVLLLIVSGRIEITIDEIGIISDYIQAEAGNNANIIMGIGEDENLEESISVTIVATGFPTEIQRAINHEEKKIFHKLEEPYEQRLKKMEEISSFSKKEINLYPMKKNNLRYSEKTFDKKENFSLNQKENVFEQSINSNFVESKQNNKKYLMLEDSFDFPISYNNDSEKTLKKSIHKKENNKGKKFNDF
ncbi:cell division protein FtsZ [Blattabacterium cuenoti]|uniref:cell division protein FtsZ n=1 Tax=Blattabacterium cuenoti TaxID=1653831 RepID=UPI00163CA797|nr:cell division protein FtsZ [Blattabacterium cuenoti]